MVTKARMWMGPALAGLFGITILALWPVAENSPLALWTLTRTLALERVLPMIGLGALFGLIGIRALGAAFLLFVFGTVAGLVAEHWLLGVLDAVPQAATHDFLAGPISCLAVGTALAAGTRPRPILAPIAALLSGVMLGLVVSVTDPSLHDPAYTWTPVLLAVWIIVAISSTIRAFWRDWFAVFGRILGSWLLAIGLLYGGAMLVSKPKPPPPPAPPASLPNLDRTFPDLDRPRDQPGLDAFPGGTREGPE